MSARRQLAFEYFVQMGWTPAQSAGIVANLEAESGLRHDAVGDSGTAWGLAQWRGERQSNFEALFGKTIQQSSFDDQLAFVHAELQRAEKHAGDALAACTTAAAAADTICRLYERPKYPDKDAAIRAALADTILSEYGGQAAPAPVQQPEKSMAPLLFLPAILEMIPSLMGIFGKGERAQQNAQAAQIVVDAFKAAVPGATNEQDAIQKVQADPALKAQVKAAVMADPNVLGLVEVGGGVVAARTANLALVAGAQKWWQLVFNPVFLVTLLTLPLVYMFTWGLLPFLSKVSSDVISQTMGTIIGLVLGSVMGFWMGQTYTNNQRRSSDPPA